MNEKEKRIEKLEEKIIGPKSRTWVICSYRARATEEEKAKARREGVKRWEEEHGQELNLAQCNFIEIEIHGGSLAVEQAR